MSIFRGIRKKKRKKEIISQGIDGWGSQLNSSLDADFEENRRIFRDLFTDCYDVIFHPFRVGEQVQAELIYIQNMSNVEEINENVLTPLMEKKVDPRDFQTILERRLPISSAKPVSTFSEGAQALTMGNALLLIKGVAGALDLGMNKWEKRGITEPENEPVIRGPKEGFIESVRINTTLIRRRLRTPQLKLKSLHLGRYTHTEVIVAYMEDIVHPDLLEEVIRRLERIDIDGVIDSGYIEGFIEDHPFSPFPQVLTTEKTDVVTAELLEGRIAILVDGSPVVLVVPITLTTMLQAAEDYYSRYIPATMIRSLRYLMFLVSIALPSFYVATTTFHQEAIPTEQLISFAAAREQIPVPCLVEALLMEFAFEALREAGLRLPRIIGSAVTIVGALVIGEAAVTAGLVSAPMVIVVAATGIASFTIPRYALGLPMRALRFPLLILSGTLGIVGMLLGLFAIVVHLCTLSSFGVPYLSPLAPWQKRDLKDVLWRAPWWKMDRRPQELSPSNLRREAPDQKPGPAQGGDRRDSK